MRHIMLSLLLLVPAKAAALTPHEEALTKIFAELAYAEHRCENLELNYTAFSLVALEKKVDIHDWANNGRLRPLAGAYGLIQKTENDSTPTETYCRNIEKKYGADGSFMPGALLRK